MRVPFYKEVYMPVSFMQLDTHACKLTRPKLNKLMHAYMYTAEVLHMLNTMHLLTKSSTDTPTVLAAC